MYSLRLLECCMVGRRCRFLKSGVMMREIRLLYRGIVWKELSEINFLKVLRHLILIKNDIKSRCKSKTSPSQPMLMQKESLTFSDISTQKTLFLFMEMEQKWTHLHKLLNNSCKRKFTCLKIIRKFQFLALKKSKSKQTNKISNIHQVF